MTVKRMDKVGIVVEDFDADIEFFTELGLELEGRAAIAAINSEGLLVSEEAFAFSPLRGQDLNLRPRGYEPRELPDCSTPRIAAHRAA